MQDSIQYGYGQVTATTDHYHCSKLKDINPGEKYFHMDELFDVFLPGPSQPISKLATYDVHE